MLKFDIILCKLFRTCIRQRRTWQTIMIFLGPNLWLFDIHPCIYSLETKRSRIRGHNINVRADVKLDDWLTTVIFFINKNFPAKFIEEMKSINVSVWLNRNVAINLFSRYDDFLKTCLWNYQWCNYYASSLIKVSFQRNLDLETM